MKRMNIGLIASIAYGINAAYCASIGEERAPWSQAPEPLKQGMMQGVQSHIDNPDITPEQSHELWLASKQSDGWEYGEVVSHENKTHPNIVPYEKLPQEQKSKDYLFKAVVAALKDLPDAEDAEQLAGKLVSLQKTILDNQKTTVPLSKKQVVGVGVRYIGRKAQYKDSLYGTGFVFERGVTLVLPEDTANKFLSHAEFERADAVGQVVDERVDDQIKKDEDLKRQKEEALFDEIESIKKIGSKKAVVEYIESRYGDKVDETQKLDALKAIAIEKVHQFGAV